LSQVSQNPLKTVKYIINIAVLSEFDRCRTATTILPCSLDACHWLPHTSTLTWKPSQGTKLYCLVNRGTLARRTCPRSLPDNAAAGSRTRDISITSPSVYEPIAVKVGYVTMSGTLPELPNMGAIGPHGGLGACAKFVTVCEIKWYGFYK